MSLTTMRSVFSPANPPCYSRGMSHTTFALSELTLQPSILGPSGQRAGHVSLTHPRLD